MILISTSPRFHVEAWLPFRNREMDVHVKPYNYFPRNMNQKNG